MMRQRRKTEFRSGVKNNIFNSSDSIAMSGIVRSKYCLADYVKFVFYCMLLVVPVYAIAVSAMKQDWLMMIIDALLVPVGFVHGLLLIFGFVT